MNSPELDRPTSGVSGATPAARTVPALPLRLRLALALGLSARSRLDVLCELVDYALDAGLDTGADDLGPGLDAALDTGDRGPLAAALSRIFAD